ncbi:U-box domain-containing protein 4 [Hibiscus syriacus]|uniref:RING-type E3 ubiquitin transferase n=1 Tax=Hibiscus syriacus TaxID=106335 RepID=A0A6A3B2H8_HIBSY|nr:U-box domain-containing protein 4-like [Hibiscus syriacus]XP_038994824.1 U-box domain-containing protein 4-like [Hibiscus syriacus]KAE8709565.1 U-box domain-containing protein 4 [Hibiscus syriacus]
MGSSSLETLLRKISSFSNLSSFENINSEPVRKYYRRAEEMLNLLKPMILNAKFTSDEEFSKAFEEFGLFIEELQEQFESWQPILSRVYLVLQVEALISKIQNSSLDIFKFLKSSNQHLPYELSLASLEEIEHGGDEQASALIKEAMRYQADSVGPSLEVLVRIAESLSLNSNQEILLEVVALEKLKENAEKADKTAEVECIDQLIALVIHMHDHLVLTKKSQTSSTVLIPSDFICPLSLEPMTDPVIVASGQTYERTFIKKWFDVGLTVCPKTRKKLSHTYLVPNYTIKALIVNWCEVNNVKLPDLMKSSLNQPCPLLVHAASGLPKDSNSFLNSRSNHQMSPKSQSTSQSDHTRKSLLETLLRNISSFFNLSSLENVNSEPVHKYYLKTEEILKLLQPIILEEIFDSKITSDEVLTKASEELSLSVEELRGQFESWQPLFSKVYFVLQVESLISKIRNFSLDIFPFKSSNQHIPYELSSASLEHCLQKIKHVGDEQISSVIEEAIRDRLDNSGPRAEILVIIAERLNLNSNQKILIEAVALEKLKENAEQDDKTAEVEYIDKLIALVTRMHHRIILIKQSQISSPVLIPSDFICPLSLELMIDPVIVASGKTYERAFIKQWIDLGLTMCPKTRQKLTHTSFIPNYTVKALIANWCESTNVMLPDPMKFMSLNAPYPCWVKKLVEDLKNTSIDIQREATAKLRFLSKQNRDNRIIITNFGAISFLVDLLHSPDTKTQENAVTSLLNLSNIDSNKTDIANANAIDPLIHVLETGSPVAKENTAATLFSLSVIEDNRVKIGRSGAIRPLVDLLLNGTPRGKKDAATALFNLSRFHENKARIVQAGAVRYLVDLFWQSTAGMVDKAVFVLAKLATIPEGRTAIEQHGGIPILVEVVEVGSARGKENAAAALLHLCICSPRFCNLVLQEGAIPSLVELSKSGTPRAKEKAQALISRLQNTKHGYAVRG